MKFEKKNRSFTWLLDRIKSPLILTYSLHISFRPKNIIWNFEGLVFMPLSVNHYATTYVGHFLI